MLSNILYVHVCRSVPNFFSTNSAAFHSSPHVRVPLGQFARNSNTHDCAGKSRVLRYLHCTQSANFTAKLAYILQLLFETHCRNETFQWYSCVRSFPPCTHGFVVSRNASIHLHMCYIFHVHLVQLHTFPGSHNFVVFAGLFLAQEYCNHNQWIFPL